MFRILKYSVGTLAACGLAGFLFFGSDLTSMISTTAKSVQRTVKEAVPLEFELQRAKERIGQILPDLQSQVRMIAEEEVAVARLGKEVAADQTRVDQQEVKLTALRESMRTRQVSYSVGQVDLNRQQLAERFQTRFNHFKQARSSLEIKQRLLEKRKEGLAAAIAMLDKMRGRHSELKLKVEALAAQHRLIKASQIEAGKLVDGSQLSQADQLLDKIETRLQVAERVMNYDQDALALPAESIAVSEADVLSEFDAYFGPSPHASVAQVEVETK